VLAAAAYFVTALLSYEFAARPEGVVTVWLPSGVLLGALLLIPRPLWPFAMLGAYLGNLGADLLYVGAHWWGFAGAAVNTLEAWLAAYLLRRFVGDRITLGSVRDVIGFIGFAVILGNSVTSVLGAFVLTHGSLHELPYRWLIWWVGDGMGMLMLTPPILTVYHDVRIRRRLSTTRAAEAALSLLAFAALTVVLLRFPADFGIWHPAFLLLPMLMLLALRSGPSAAAAGTLIVYAVSTWLDVHRLQVFAEPGASPTTQVLAMSAFLTLVSVTALVTASILHERERAIAELTVSEGRLHEMAEHIQEAFFTFDLPSGEPLYVSPGWATISGRSMADAYDPAPWSEAVLDEDRTLVTESQAANMRGEAATVTFRIRRPDGSVRTLRARTYPVKDESGVVRRAVGAAEDVTELVGTRDRLRQAEKLEAVGNLAGGVAHDFNNMLTVILSYSSLLLAEESLSDDQREQLAAIRQAAEKAAALTRQLLIFSRRQPAKSQELHVNDILSGIGKMLRRLIPENIALTLSAEAPRDTIRADPVQIEQVIVNLVVNARDAMPNGGLLTIETRTEVVRGTRGGAYVGVPDGEYVVLQVTDTGAGMDDATKAHMFEPFFTTKERGRGTGLGLSTVHGIVSSSGGQIGVESSPGRGTTFRVHFPVAEPVHARAAVVSLEESVPRGTESVLVVEDDPEVRTIVRDVLTGHGYRVSAFSDASAALAWLLNAPSPVHLLLSDVMLPGMSGRELANLVREIYPTMRVLLVSGYEEEDVSSSRAEHDDVLFLEKPFAAERLARRVREAIDTERRST